MAIRVLPLPFATPNVPDLGCFKSRKHGFQDILEFPHWAEPPPWEFVNGVPTYIPHQVYIRIACGEAAFYQRVSAWQADLSSPPPVLLGVPPAWVLGGDHRPVPTDWVKFPVQQGPMNYWLFGQHRNPAQASWSQDAAVGHSFDLYSNGTLSTVGWDDTGGDRDFNDLVVEVAVVYRRSYFIDLKLPRARKAEAARFAAEHLPGIRAADRPPSG